MLRVCHQRHGGARSVVVKGNVASSPPAPEPAATLAAPATHTATHSNPPSKPRNAIIFSPCVDFACFGLYRVPAPRHANDRLQGDGVIIITPSPDFPAGTGAAVWSARYGALEAPQEVFQGGGGSPAGEMKGAAARLPRRDFAVCCRTGRYRLFFPSSDRSPGCCAAR